MQCLILSPSKEIMQHLVGETGLTVLFCIRRWGLIEVRGSTTSCTDFVSIFPPIVCAHLSSTSHLLIYGQRHVGRRDYQNRARCHCSPFSRRVCQYLRHPLVPSLGGIGVDRVLGWHIPGTVQRIVPRLPPCFCSGHRRRHVLQRPPGDRACSGPMLQVTSLGALDFDALGPAAGL